MMKKQKIMLYRIIAAAVIYVLFLYWNIWENWNFQSENSGAVFIIYDTLSDRGMGHHLPGCAQYQSWSGI